MVELHGDAVQEEKMLPQVLYVVLHDFNLVFSFLELDWHEIDGNFQ